MDWEGGRLIDWHHERCGKSEEAHAVMKEDLAGGKLPSGKFGENAHLAADHGPRPLLTRARSLYKLSRQYCHDNIVRPLVSLS